MAGSGFTPFAVPVGHDDVPLVQHAGAAYRCTGCGGPVPDGAWLYETVEDGLVVGLRATAGAGGHDIHRCGKA